MASTGTRVEFRDVSKVFTTAKREVVAVDGVTLTVEPGEILGVIGYSGAGKSTLVRLINGLGEPTEGEVLVDTVDVAKHGDFEWDFDVAVLPNARGLDGEP